MRRFVCAIAAALLGVAACDLTGRFDLPPFALLTTGGNHSCALSPDGDAFCWGSDSSGQLGLGGPSTQPRPNPTALSNQPRLAFVKSWSRHTCAVDLSFRGARCWGENGSGQLGTGDSVSEATPTPVAVPVTVTFATVATGELHTCGLVSTDSTLVCWGDNTYGQLGDSSNTSAPTPVRVASGIVRFVSLATGGRHACALDPEGAAFCWGDNVNGQLGDGSTLESNAPVPSATAFRFLRIVTGDAHTCGRTTNSEVVCWGRGAEGQLGVTSALESCGGTPCSTAPVLVGDFTIFLTAGAQHTCAVTSNRRASCWGRNTDGQLGTVTTVQCNGVACSPTPVAVSGDLSLVSIVAGGSHTCAFAATGDAFCWGANGSGQLGDGSTTTRFTPVRVRAP